MLFLINSEQLLRWRPPPPLVPHVAACDFPLTENFTIPAGSIVFPSTIEASRQWPRGDEFDISRFITTTDKNNDEANQPPLLTFGYGQHSCPGRHYAQQHLILFIVTAVQCLSWERVITDWQTRNILTYLPTIYPRDGIFHFAWNE